MRKYSAAISMPRNRRSGYSPPGAADNAPCRTRSPAPKGSRPPPRPQAAPAGPAPPAPRSRPESTRRPSYRRRRAKVGSHGPRAGLSVGGRAAGGTRRDRAGQYIGRTRAPRTGEPVAISSSHHARATDRPDPAPCADRPDGRPRPPHAHLPDLRQRARRAQVQALLPRPGVRVLPLLCGLFVEEPERAAGWACPLKRRRVGGKTLRPAFFLTVPCSARLRPCLRLRGIGWITPTIPRSLPHPQGEEGTPPPGLLRDWAGGFTWSSPTIP